MKNQLQDEYDFSIVAYINITIAKAPQKKEPLYSIINFFTSLL
jgi:hypothetical protein